MIIRVKTGQGYLSATDVKVPAKLGVDFAVMQYRPEAGAWEQFEIEGMEELVSNIVEAVVARLTSPTPPAPPAPPTPIPEPPVSYHVAPGPLTIDAVFQIVMATAREYPDLTEVCDTEEQAITKAEELLLRIIWHLKLYGFEAGRQRNPSKAISNDKFCVYFGSTWHVFDCMSLGFAGRATRMVFQEITGANPIDDDGIAD